jgi:hypothetical protein
VRPRAGEGAGAPLARSPSSAVNGGRPSVRLSGSRPSVQLGRGRQSVRPDRGRQSGWIARPPGQLDRGRPSGWIEAVRPAGSRPSVLRRRHSAFPSRMGSRTLASGCLVWKIRNTHAHAHAHTHSFRMRGRGWLALQRTESPEEWERLGVPRNGWLGNPLSEGLGALPSWTIQGFPWRPPAGRTELEDRHERT